MIGHCSKCGKVWTLNEGQGVCQWCSQSANLVTTKTKPRRLKFSPRQRQKQDDHNNNGYDQLPEPFYTFYTIASHFAYKAKLDEREDLLHDIIEGLASVAKRKQLQGQEFSEPAMYRTAEHIKDHYWYRHYSYHNGLDCQHCSKAQRAKCRKAWAHSDWAYTDCHRAIQLESINQPVIDNEGNITELAELIADDKALDLAEWIDAKTFLIGSPIRLKLIAKKLSKGEALTGGERVYLTKLRQKTQKQLV